MRIELILAMPNHQKFAGYISACPMHYPGVWVKLEKILIKLSIFDVYSKAYEYAIYNVSILYVIVLHCMH